MSPEVRPFFQSSFRLRLPQANGTTPTSSAGASPEQGLPYRLESGGAASSSRGSEAEAPRGETSMLTDKLPRVRLAHLPTPLQEMPRLARALGGPRLFVKRDDQTGLATGGNKARN